jgi:hypothetical protein
VLAPVNKRWTFSVASALKNVATFRGSAVWLMQQVILAMLDNRKSSNLAESAQMSITMEVVLNMKNADTTSYTEKLPLAVNSGGSDKRIFSLLNPSVALKLPQVCQRDDIRLPPGELHRFRRIKFIDFSPLFKP